jgi:SAM-dependent methyltransferase
MFKGLKEYFNNQISRDRFVLRHLAALPKGAALLDAGAGSQRYRPNCAELDYKTQDFGKVTIDQTRGFAALQSDSEYGPLDYICDITKIPAADASFEAVLCTEVFEHIPDPIAAMRELSRLLRPGGRLILTVPSNCLRHFDPYFFYSGFSDHWLRHWLGQTGLEVIDFEQDGNYFKWMAVEIARSGKLHPLALPVLIPAFLWYYLKSIKPTQEAKATLCGGYYVCARKLL